MHEPLARAIARLTPALIVETARTAAAALRRDFGMAAPRLAVVGLNPHAGEDGTLGTEDRDIVAPAVAALRAGASPRAAPCRLTRCSPPRRDRATTRRSAWYHDQALIPIKTLDMAGGVNVTLGLSIVRTSPDHGTALDIAGTGRADPSSLVAALMLAAEIARIRA